MCTLVLPQYLYLYLKHKYGHGPGRSRTSQVQTASVLCTCCHVQTSTCSSAFYTDTSLFVDIPCHSDASFTIVATLVRCNYVQSLSTFDYYIPSLIVPEVSSSLCDYDVITAFPVLTAIAKTSYYSLQQLLPLLRTTY